MVRPLIALLCCLVLATPAWAGLDEGVAAHERGDYETALREFRALAEQSDADALNYLGLMYAKGQGVPQNYAQAARWYGRAAERGDAAAQYNLGLAYGKGHGVPQNRTQAHMWLDLAAAQGFGPAAENRDMIAKRMTPADVSKAQRMARQWLVRHGGAY